MYIYKSAQKEHPSMNLPLASKSANNYVHDLPTSTRTSHKTCHVPSSSLPTTLILLLTLLLSLTPTTASAHPAVIQDSLADRLPDSPASFRSEFAELAADGIILTDPRPSVRPSAWDVAAISAELLKRDHVELDKRQSASSSVTSSRSLTTSISPSRTSSSTSSTSSTTSASKTQETAALPSPFDDNVGANFTAGSCPDFLNSFLNAPEFKACLPFSLLLEVHLLRPLPSRPQRPANNPQSSQSFFETTKSPYLTTALLDHTCASNVTACTPYLSTLAATLTQPTACGADFAARNPTVMLARNGLIAYAPLYSSSCLKAPSGSYCFADAVTNTTSPTDSYVYYLGLGEELPAGSQMTCSACLRNTMAVLGAAAANRSQPVAAVYEGGARVVNSFCGPAWVNASIPAALSGAAREGGGMAGVLAAGVGIVAVLVLL